LKFLSFGFLQPVTSRNEGNQPASSDNDDDKTFIAKRAREAEWSEWQNWKLGLDGRVRVINEEMRKRGSRARAPKRKETVDDRSGAKKLEAKTKRETYETVKEISF
jgi:hypothetical protein